MISGDLKLTMGATTDEYSESKNEEEETISLILQVTEVILAGLSSDLICSLRSSTKKLRS